MVVFHHVSLIRDSPAKHHDLGHEYQNSKVSSCFWSHFNINELSLWESRKFIMQVFNLCEKEAMPYAEYNLTFKSYFRISFPLTQVFSTLTMTFSGNKNSNNMLLYLFLTSTWTHFSF